MPTNTATILQSAYPHTHVPDIFCLRKQLTQDALATTQVLIHEQAGKPVSESLFHHSLGCEILAVGPPFWLSNQDVGAQKQQKSNVTSSFTSETGRTDNKGTYWEVKSKEGQGETSELETLCQHVPPAYCDSNETLGQKVVFVRVQEKNLELQLLQKWLEVHVSESLLLPDD